MKKLYFTLLCATLLCGPRWAFADNPILSAVCSNVDCLNNFTAKTGYSFALKKEGTGGYTDLKQDWYLSPAPGFNFLGNDIYHPNLDINVVFKAGKLLSDEVPYIHDFVNSHPFTQGLLKYTTIGETGSPDFHGNFYDMTWVGATINW